MSWEERLIREDGVDEQVPQPVSKIQEVIATLENYKALGEIYF